MAVANSGVREPRENENLKLRAFAKRAGWSKEFLYSITKHAMRRSADEIGATSISFRPKVFSDPASVVD
jgi:hypothetical protein